MLAIQETFNVLERARMPVLMAIQGGCVGGAVDFATACDCRYATEDAFFVIQEINIGMTADVGTFPRLCHLMPEGHGARARLFRPPHAGEEGARRSASSTKSSRRRRRCSIM